MDASSTQSVNILETFNAYQYRNCKLNFWSYNLHIFRFSRSGKGEVDVYRFMSKHSSDQHVLFQLSRSLVTPRHRCVIMHEVVDESLPKICHYQKNVPQHFYVLDTLVIIINEFLNRINPWVLESTVIIGSCKILKIKKVKIQTFLKF